NPLGDDAPPLSFIQRDPPEHKRLRALCSRPFTPGRLRGYEPMVRRITGELIDSFVERGRVELISEFASPLPTAVILDVFGYEKDDLEWVLPWALVQSGGFAYLPPDEQERQRGYAAVARERMTAKIVERREHPGDDALSELIRLFEQDQ